MVINQPHIPPGCVITNTYIYVCVCVVNPNIIYIGLRDGYSGCYMLKSMLARSATIWLVSESMAKNMTDIY